MKTVNTDLLKDEIEGKIKAIIKEYSKDGVTVFLNADGINISVWLSINRDLIIPQSRARQKQS